MTEGGSPAIEHLTPKPEALPPEELEKFRARFPVLGRRIDDAPIIYLDSAATSLRSMDVRAAESAFDDEIGASAHRAQHSLGLEATDKFEEARASIAEFFGAHSEELVFTSHATHAANLVLRGTRIPSDGNIVTTEQEHHSLVLPLLDEREIRFAHVGVDGRIDPDEIAKHVDARTALVCLGHASNVTGAVQDISALVARIRRQSSARILLDCAQSAPHVDVSLRRFQVDYIMVSAHKLGGPTGVGLLLGTRDALAALTPLIRGGGAVRKVTTTGATWHEGPRRLEPGTPHAVGAIGFAAALQLLQRVGIEKLRAHGAALAMEFDRTLGDDDRIARLGPPGTQRLPLASLYFPKLSPTVEKLAEMLSARDKIMVRAGRHCAHPFFDGIGVNGTLRASAWAYNTLQEVDAFARAIKRILHGLRG